MLKNQKVFEHILGTSQTEDRVVLDKGLTQLAQIALDSDPTSKWIVASAEDGDGGKYANFLRLPDGSWQQVSTYSDEVVAITPGTAEEDVLYLTSLKNAPRGKILEISAKTPVLAEAKTIIPEGTASIEHDDPGSDSHRVLVTKDRLYVTTIDGGPNRVQVYDHKGRPLPDVPLPPVSGISEVTGLGAEALAIQVSSFLTPPAYLTYQPPECSTRGYGTFAASKRHSFQLCSRQDFCDFEGWDQDSNEHHPPARIPHGWNCSNPR